MSSQEQEKKVTGQPPICSYEGSDYQRSFWEQADRAYEDRVEAVALRRLMPDSGELLLEIGAGAGRNTPRYKGFERVVLLDYSRTQLEQARERLGDGSNYLYIAADAYRLPFIPGLFDAATMIRTLHHMADPAAAIAQVHRILHPDGVFILEYANKLNLKAIARYFLRRQDWSPFTLEPVEFVKLNFDFHPHAVRSWLAGTGFEIKRQLTVSHFRIRLLKRWVPLNLLVWLDSLAQLTGDFWQLTPSVFVRSTGGSSPVNEGFFRCPQCGHFPLEAEPDRVPCPNCGRVWPVEDSIYDFRTD
jgi:SAM-dependent methyltransferase